MTVLLIALFAFVGALTLLGISQTQVRASARSQDRMMGLVLAEAGIDDAVAQISSDPTFTGRSGTVYENPPTNSKKFGTYETTVTVVDDLKRKITATGTNPNGTTSQVVAIITIDTRALGNAALMANGPIDVSGTMYVNSVPTPNVHISHVYANGNIAMGGSSYVDGHLASAGTVVGTAYYPSESGVPPYPYPTKATTDQWRAEWKSAALAGGTIGNISNSTTITAPKYITGGINLSSDKVVVLNGPGIIYVDGNVKLTGQAVLNNGATLVVTGTFNQQGQTVYRMKTGVVPTPTMVVYGTGYPVTSDVIDIAGGAIGDQQGVVYAVNGSIKVAGGSTFVGALVAGAPGAHIGAIGGYMHLFPENMASSVAFPTAASVIGVTEP